MFVTINELNPQKRFLSMAAETLGKGGIIIYPTDTVYAYGCDISNKKAIERIYRLKKIPRNKPLSFIFDEITSINPYVNRISDSAFLFMKKYLPGPYTMVMKGSRLIPDLVLTNQKTIGVRIPDSAVARQIVTAFGKPVISASLSSKTGEYIIRPEDLEKEFRNVVDMIIDAGPKISEPSTVIDFTGLTPEIIRHGKGTYD